MDMSVNQGAQYTQKTKHEACLIHATNSCLPKKGLPGEQIVIAG